MDRIDIDVAQGPPHAQWLKAVLMVGKPVGEVAEAMDSHAVFDPDVRALDPVVLVQGVSGEHLDLVPTSRQLHRLGRHDLWRTAVRPSRGIVGNHLEDVERPSHVRCQRPAATPCPAMIARLR